MWLRDVGDSTDVTGMEDHRVDRDLRRRYGIGVEDYNRMIEAQNGLCAVCKQPERLVRHGRPSPLMVDHNHLTGRVRGLLCARCNLGLAWLEDAPGRLDELLASAVEYLAKEAAA